MPSRAVEYYRCGTCLRHTPPKHAHLQGLLQFMLQCVNARSDKPHPSRTSSLSRFSNMAARGCGAGVGHA